MYQSKEHFRATYENISPRFTFRGESVGDLREWQGEFRPKVATAIGLKNLESDLRSHAPKATHHQSIDMVSYTREKWVLTVEPTVPLPFYLLRPKKQTVPVPLVITPHGHNHPDMYVGITYNEEEQKHLLEGERDIAVQAVNQGYLVIAPETRAFGSTRTPEDVALGVGSSCRTQLMHGLLAGRTPIGERVWDMKLLIDWAIKNLDIDSDRIAMPGNSGGGTVTLYSAACDERISVAMPGSYFSTFKDTIGTIKHCDCNYVPGILRLGEMYDVAGLIAPRPFLAIAGNLDPIFPIESVKFAFRKLKETYQVVGYGDNCELFVGDGGHRYYKEEAWPFVANHFSSTNYILRD